MKNLITNHDLEESSPLVCIVILNWNGFEVTVPCVNSLGNSTYWNTKIIIIDNGSQDGSVKRLKETFSDIDLLALDRNYGFTGGSNKGIKFAMDTYDPAYVLLLNNDTVVEKNAIQEMVLMAEGDNGIGVIVPKIYYYDRPDRVYYAGGSLKTFSGIGRHYGWKKIDSVRFSKPRAVTFMNACAPLLRTLMIKEIGVFDDRFFANIEDADYSKRIIDHGYTIMFQPRAKIWHKEGYSSRKNKGEWFRIYLTTRNIILFQRKHLSMIYLVLFAIYFSIRWVAYMTLKSLVLGDWKSIKGIFQGLMDGLTGRLRWIEN